MYVLCKICHFANLDYMFVHLFFMSPINPLEWVCFFSPAPASPIFFAVAFCSFYTIFCEPDFYGDGLPTVILFFSTIGDGFVLAFGLLESGVR